MTNSFNQKYKDKTPQETIGTIKQFFSAYNYFIKEDFIKQKESTSWYCDLSLYYKDRPYKFLTSHGKGITKEFALASGYAEMYERFANYMLVGRFPLLVEFIQNYNKKHYDYYLDPQEQKITVEDIIKSNNYYKAYLEKIVDINNPNFNTLEFAIGKLIGIPFKNINNYNDIQYHNLPLYIKLNASNGMAAGNTLEEATVQGIGEIIEREVLYKFERESNKSFIIIDLASIKSKTTLKMIDAIHKTGNELFIFDLSYTYNWPVVVACIYNNKNKNYTCFSRCHPVFELAVEGAITECYQRNILINDTYYFYVIDENLFKTWNKNLTDYEPKLTGKHNRDYNVPSEEIFINSTIKNQFNSNCFLKIAKYSSDDLLEYYKQLAIKNNCNFYTYNTSLDNMFHSVLVYCPEFIPLGILKNTENYIDKLVQELDKIGNQKFSCIKDIIFNILTNNLCENYKNIMQLFGTCNLITAFEPDFDYHLQIDKANFNRLLAKVLYDDLKNPQESINLIYKFYSNLLNTEYQETILKYATLFRYRKNGYSEKECHKIFKIANGKDFTQEDWINCINMRYICKEIIWPKFKELYSDSFLEDLLKPFLITKKC